MQWSDLKEVVGKAAPILGTLLGGPAGAAIGGLVSAALGVDNTPDAVNTALVSDPDAAVKLKQIEADQQTKLAQIAADENKARIDAAKQGVSDVNQTMQAEAKSDHWPTYAWRPFIGFVFGFMGLVLALTVSACYLGVMFFHTDAGPLATLPAMLGAMIGVMGIMSPILGIASYYRGKMQANPAMPTDNRG